MNHAIKVHGGKHYLASKIVKLFPRSYLTYCEPYFGGGSVLFAANPNGRSEIANDLDGELTNFWEVMQSEKLFPKFERVAQATPFSENEYKMAGMNPANPQEVRAMDFFVRCRMSLAGRKQAFAPISTSRVRRGMNEQVSAWLTAVDGLREVHERLRRVLILNRPAIEVIKQFDTKQTLYYLDPPYLHETRKTTKEYGDFEMSRDNHVELLTVLAGINGKFLLSGYRSDLYDDFAKRNKWKRHEFTLANSAASGKTKRRMVECVWSNY